MTRAQGALSENRVVGEVIFAEPLVVVRSSGPEGVEFAPNCEIVTLGTRKFERDVGYSDCVQTDIQQPIGG